MKVTCYTLADHQIYPNISNDFFIRPYLSPSLFYVFPLHVMFVLVLSEEHHAMMNNVPAFDITPGFRLHARNRNAGRKLATREYGLRPDRGDNRSIALQEPGIKGYLISSIFVFYFIREKTYNTCYFNTLSLILVVCWRVVRFACFLQKHYWLPNSSIVSKKGDQNIA